MRFRASALLPKLAWILRLKEGSGVADVIHGPWVETGDDYLVEGAWAGEFQKRDFDRNFMTGTAARVMSAEILIATPSHTLDRVCLLRKGDELHVSNSLPLVLADALEGVDDSFPLYDSYVSSIKYGLKRYERKLRTSSGAYVELYYAANLAIAPNLAVTALPKPRSQSFSEFDEYVSYLKLQTGKVAENARDRHRRVIYTPLCTLSRGYDSPAASVIARYAGCSEALTFTTSRGTSDSSDCGTPIAEKLGLRSCEYDRLAYRHQSDLPEILNSGGPNEFLSFGEGLAGRLLFTGFHGDKVWDRNCDKVSDDFVRGDSSGASLTEFRLHVGFFHLPVPFVGADNHPDIASISMSEEMTGWSTRNDYDRPIPRRIVEEAGIARTMFGQKKRAAGVVVTRESLAETMGPASLVDFLAFANRHRRTIRAPRMYFLKAVKRLVRYDRAARNFAVRVIRRMRLPHIRIPFIVPHRLEMESFGYLGKEAYLFHWGIGKLIDKYRDALHRL